MTGIIERIGSLAGTEWAQATNFAHKHFQQRMGEHRHTGRAFVETVAEVAREHNNLVGLGVGILVERLLQAEKERHDAAHPDIHPPEGPLDRDGWTLIPHDGEPPPPRPVKKPPPPNQFDLAVFHQSPGKVALEVFGALLLLKLAATGAKLFRRKDKRDVWFAPAARIRLFSGALAAYFLVAALRSPRLSAWRNGAIFFFGTDAIKPVVRAPRRVRRKA